MTEDNDVTHDDFDEKMRVNNNDARIQRLQDEQRMKRELQEKARRLLDAAGLNDIDIECHYAISETGLAQLRVDYQCRLSRHAEVAPVFDGLIMVLLKEEEIHNITLD